MTSWILDRLAFTPHPKHGPFFCLVQRQHVRHVRHVAQVVRRRAQQSKSRILSYTGTILAAVEWLFLLSPVSTFQAPPRCQAETKTSKTLLLSSKTTILNRPLSMPTFSSLIPGKCSQHEAASSTVWSFLFHFAVLLISSLLFFAVSSLILSP